MSNEMKYYIRGAVGVFAGIGACGGVLTAFYAELGFSNGQIASFGTMGSIVQIAVYVASIFLADKFKNIKQIIAWLSLSSILPCLALLPFSMGVSEDTNAAYYLYMAASCVYSVLTGLCGLLMYRLPYLIIDMKEFAKLENVNNIVSNSFSIAGRVLLTVLTAVIAVRSIMTVGMLIGIVFSVIYTVLVLSMKTEGNRLLNGQGNSLENESGESKESGKKQAFSFKKFNKIQIRYFHIPNFLRGITSGAIAVIAIVCMQDITNNATVLSGLATISAVSMIGGSVLYQALRKKVSTVNLFFAASIGMFLFLPLMLVGKNVIVFCVFFCLVYIGYSIISSTAAVYATEIVDYQDIGTYSAVRLIAIMAGQAVGCQGIAWAMDYVPSIVIMAVCGVSQLISGIMYYRYERKYR